MTENELQTLIQEGIPSQLMVYISDFPEHLDLLMNIAFDDNENRNWRAVWMIDRIHEKHPELVLTYLPAMTDFVLTTQNSGKKRHLLKLISLHEIPDDKMAIFLNYCIDIFTSAAEPVAVRVHAMQILFNITVKEPDFTGELIDLIEHEIEYHGSAGISSRGRKLLKELYKRKF